MKRYGYQFQEIMLIPELVVIVIFYFGVLIIVMATVALALWLFEKIYQN